MGVSLQWARCPKAGRVAGTVWSLDWSLLRMLTLLVIVSCMKPQQLLGRF